MSTLDPRPGRNREAALIMAPLGAVCVLGAASAIVPDVEHVTSLVVIALGVLVALAVGLRFGVRWVRERIEDRADARTAAAYRAARDQAREMVGEVA